MSRRSARPRYTLLLLILASATVLTLNYRGHAQGIISGAKSGARDVLAPVQSALGAVLRPVGNFFEGALHYGSLQQENARLEAQNQALRSQAQGAQAAERENQSLRKVLNLPYLSGMATVAAEVISTSPSNFTDTVVLDKGRGAGVDVGMPVVSGGGLIGRVIEASRDRSTVLLITDPTSNVGVRFGGTQGNLAVAAGQGANQPLRVDFVDPHTKVSKGVVMTTSGLQDARFPADIPVGTVRAAHLRSSALQWDITLAPSVDLAQMQFVDVLEWAPSS